MSQECELLDRQAEPTLFVRARASARDLPEVLPKAWAAIMEHADRVGVQPSGAPYVAYHNMDMQDLDLEIGFTFPHEVTGEGEVVRGDIPGGRAVACLHVGPYEQISAAYDALHEWMETNQVAPSGAAYEFYLNSPLTTPPAELRTQVVLPLA
jgi:effector-binding domain-containing protein